MASGGHRINVELAIVTLVHVGGAKLFGEGLELLTRRFFPIGVFPETNAGTIATVPEIVSGLIVGVTSGTFDVGLVRN